MKQALLIVGDNHLTKRLIHLLAPGGHSVIVSYDTLPDGAYDSIVIATVDDSLNLDLALAALERFPQSRLVVRIDAPILAKGLQERLTQTMILCPPDIAASSFAAAAVHPSLQGALEVQGELNVLWETRNPPAAAQELAVDDQGNHLVLAPWEQVKVWLWSESAVTPPAFPRRPQSVSVLPLRRRLRLDPVIAFSVVSFLLLMTFGTVFFTYAKPLALLDAFYFTASTVSTVGYGDISLSGTDSIVKLIGIVVMFAGVVSMAVLTALITDQVFRRRQGMLRGHRRSRLQGHVVLCGAGRLGVKIIDILEQMGERVVAIEPEPDPVRAGVLQAEGVHLIQADAAHRESLDFANLAQAKALIAATDEDLVNVRIALTAAEIRPSVPIVLRIFAPDLARRAQTFLGFGRTLSASRLAAEAFAAAILAEDRVRLVAEWRGRTIELVDGGDGHLQVTEDRLRNAPRR